MCDFFKDLELSDEDINENELLPTEEQPKTTMTDADKFIITGWLANEKELSDEQIIKKVEQFCDSTLGGTADYGIIHNQIDKRETLVVISFSQMTISKKPLARCFDALCRLGIKGCNVLIMLDKTTHTFQIPMEGILKNTPKAFEDLWNFIIKNGIQNGHAFTIELNPIINRFEGKVFKRENLVITNHDSQRTLNRQEMGNVENIMRHFNVSDISIHSVDPFFSLLAPPLEENFIPILLKKEMPTFEERWQRIDVLRNYKIYEPVGTALGYYSKDDCDLCKGARIVLCPEIIEQCSKQATNKISFEVLFAKVLLHEFAHVLMDNEQLNEDLFSKAMEESLANMIALQIFFEYDNSNYATVRSFIENDQPIIYQFGARQFDISADWKKWKESKKKMPTLKTWFDKCFDAGKIKQNLSYSLSDYDKVFIL